MSRHRGLDPGEERFQGLQKRAEETQAWGEGPGLGQGAQVGGREQRRLQGQQLGQPKEKQTRQCWAHGKNHGGVKPLLLHSSESRVHSSGTNWAVEANGTELPMMETAISFWAWWNKGQIFPLGLCCPRFGARETHLLVHSDIQTSPGRASRYLQQLLRLVVKMDR